MLKYLLLSVFFLTISSAAAQTVTVCEGTTSCTIVQGSQSRLMTDAELQRKNREDAISAIQSVSCDNAVDQDKCRELKRELQSLFGY